MKHLMKERYEEKRGGHGDGGFTLIELLVVIVILAILAVVVVIAVGGIQDKGQTSACQADKRTLQTAEEAYYAQNTTYVAEASLVPKYLAQESTLHNVAVSGSGNTATYSISAVAPCT
ncbi:MAG: ral secretion pathway protein [Acidimicrobiaceae bacterium]|jgi:general secretion pathway protein G